MKTLLLTPLLLAFVGCVAGPLAPVAVWEGAPPAETLKPKPDSDPKGTINPKTLGRTDVFTPEFVPWPAAKPNSPIVIICPGGGYGGLAEQHEGVTVAERLHALGCAAVVLKYRVPRRDPNKPWVVPVMDARETLRIVRARAAEWNADPKKIGIIGFSAGGHLAARLSTLGGPATYARIDEADDQPLRPDFALLVYPAYLDQGVAKFVDARTSPTFIAHAEDDKGYIKGSKLYHEALVTAKVPNDFFRVATGGHGHGLRSEKEIKAWPEQAEAWLRRSGMLAAR